MGERTLRADAQRNLELILEAARKEFAERGLDVGVADIAKRAGVGTATIFRRFPTKEELVLAVLHMRLEEVMAGLREIARRPASLDALYAAMELTLEFQIADRGYLEAGARQMFASDPRMVAGRDEYIALVAGIVRRAQAAGEVRSDVVAEDLPFLIHGLGHTALLSAQASAGLWRRYLDLVVDGLRPGAATSLSAGPPTREQLDAASARKRS